MKLRLHAGSLRLRLSQTDVARLLEEGTVREAIVFAPGKEFLYSIEAGNAAEVTATLADGSVRVLLPAAVAREWIESDRTGVEGSTGTLAILIEKDFQCLHRPPQPGEDSFPNPQAEENSK